MSKLQFITPEIELHDVELEEGFLGASAEAMNPVEGSWDDVEGGN